MILSINYLTVFEKYHPKHKIVLPFNISLQNCIKFYHHHILSNLHINEGKLFKNFTFLNNLLVIKVTKQIALKEDIRFETS